MLKFCNDIQGNVYLHLIQYAFLRCDTFTLAVPDFDSHITGKMGGDDFLDYKRRIEWQLKCLGSSLIRQYTDTKYFGSTRGYISEIYVVSTDNSSQDILTSANSLFSWRYPNLPEDLCFFSKGRCWLRSVAHESECWIDTDVDIEKDILKKIIGVKFGEIPDGMLPVIYLN